MVLEPPDQATLHPEDLEPRGVVPRRLPEVREDPRAEKAARERVHAAKVALGERGPKWWEPRSP